MRLLQRSSRLGAGGVLTIDGGLSGGSGLGDMHLGFEPGIDAGVRGGHLRFLGGHASEIENQPFQRVAACGVRQGRFQSRQPDLDAAAECLQAPLRRL